MNQLEKSTNLLRAFLSNPNWERLLHERDCHYFEDQPDSCKCGGANLVNLARELFPELEKFEYIK